LTIFAEKRKVAEFFSSKGKTCKEKERPLQSAEADSFPKRGSRECGLLIKRLFEEKMPDCCSAAPHHLALQGASPQGEAYEID